VRFDEIYPETKAIAVLRQEPSELEARGSLKFYRGYDDLDYLVFSVLSLPSKRRVALIRHQHAPNSGTEICVVPNEPAVIETLVETIRFLNVSTQDISWIHPQYERELSQKKWESLMQAQG
jgi:hypothetical protein